MIGSIRAARRRDVDRDERDEHQRQRHGGEGRGVAPPTRRGTRASAAQAPARPEAHRRARHRDHHALADDLRQNGAFGGAKRDADADFPRALRNRNVITP